MAAQDSCFSALVSYMHCSIGINQLPDSTARGNMCPRCVLQLKFHKKTNFLLTQQTQKVDIKEHKFEILVFKIIFLCFFD